MEQISVFINNFNLLIWPRKMAQYLEQIPNLRIIFVDNNSDYPPLLDFYNNCPYEIVRLDKNLGHKAPWICGAVGKYAGDYYIVTDPDLDLTSIPLDVIDVLTEGMNEFDAFRCGLSLEINDIPESFPLRDEVISWEKKYWQRKANTRFFVAALDTTFSLYNKQNRFTHNKLSRFSLGQYRADRPYTALHMPWYVTEENMEEDFWYYLITAKSCSSWGERIRRRYGIY
jgi:hypothetical protein